MDVPRPCFGTTIDRVGQCGTPTGELVAFFCTPATRAPAVNTTQGLPGPSTIAIPFHASSCACQSTNQPPDCSAARASANGLWPPNHKLVPVTIDGVTDPDGDPLAITVTGITQDEPVDARGDGHTCPDAVGVGTSFASVRVERSGSSDGRVYHVDFRATDGHGGECTGSVSLCVPHDQGGRAQTCGDQGPLFDSTAPCS